MVKPTVKTWVTPTLTLLLCVALTTQDALLFVATPGDDVTAAGMYGALVSDDKGHLKVKDKYDFKFGYHCYRDNGAVVDFLTLQAVAYDHETGHVLLHREEQSPDLVTLYEGHVCHNGGGCKRRGPRILFDGVYFRSNKPTTFGYHDRQIYFLSQEKTSKDGVDGIRNVIELRRFVGCRDKYPVTSDKRFTLQACSELLATLVDERKERVLSEPMTGLRIVRFDDGLYAFVTLQEFIFYREELQDLAVSLYSIKIGREAGASKQLRLHRERIGQAHYRRYIMKQLGNVDYKEDKLCWSAFDRILCADYFAPRDKLERVRYIVPPGAAFDVVCKGREVYGNITTGVAIADVIHDEVSLFFGCLAGVSGTGGSGFVRMRHWEYEVTPVPRAFRNVTSSLYSGQMFVTDQCRYIKRSEPTSPNQNFDLEHDRANTHVQASHSGATGLTAHLLLLGMTSLLPTIQIM